VYKCPSDPRGYPPDTKGVISSYSINNYGLCNPDNLAPTPNGGQMGANESAIPAPADTVELGEGGNGGYYSISDGQGTADGQRADGDLTLWTAWSRVAHDHADWNWTDNMPRHGDGSNIA